MILSGQTIRRLGILNPCCDRSIENGLTYGLGPAGYDLRLDFGKGRLGDTRLLLPNQFLLVASLEHFSMPADLLGRVCDKSSLARRGLSVFNTVIEPGWRGWLTLELVNHSTAPIRLIQGQAIAQVIFERLDEATERPYPEDGKYQDQPPGPQGSRA